MITRRDFIAQSITACTISAIQGCSFGSDEAGYESAVRKIWHPAEVTLAGRPALMRELVRYATLAPSSHNAQPWKFRLGKNDISILPDLRRRCPIVDPDDHHLFVSLGCAAENLSQAALANGLKAHISFDTETNDTIQIILEPVKPVVTPLFDAIPKRQCTRAEYDGKPLSYGELKLLEQAGTGNGIHVLLFTEKQAMGKVLEYVIQGNTAQMNEQAFIDELKSWIRFSDSEAMRSRDGLSTRSTGNPSVPRWLGSALFNVFFTAKSESDKYARHVRSSSGIAVFVSDRNDKAHWIEAGRAYQSFALQAAALGIRNAHLNQPVEVSTLRPQFAEFLGIGNRRPDLVVRFGRGLEMPRSLRRPMDAVLI